MDLSECRLCGRVIAAGENKVCPDCRIKLGELYGSVHEYMRDHKDEDFDIEKLSEEMNVDPIYIKTLVDLGYIEAVIKKKGMNTEQRQKLATALTNELDKFHLNRPKVTTYGGEIYARKRDK